MSDGKAVDPEFALTVVEARLEHVNAENLKLRAELAKLCAAGMEEVSRLNLQIDALKKAAGPDCLCICGHRVADHKCPPQLEESNRLNERLQNALLKMLEEYPAAVFCDVSCEKGSCEHCTLERETVAVLKQTKKRKCASCGHDDVSLGFCKPVKVDFYAELHCRTCCLDQAKWKASQ